MSQSSTCTPLRLASYNIQKCVGMDLRRQPSRILKVLDGLGAAVVLLQEADKRLPPRPAALPHFALEEAGWQVAGLGGAGSLGWHGNAVIWRHKDMRLRTVGHIALPGLEPRGAVRVDFDTPIGPLRVIGAHLGLLTRFRRQQVLHVAQALSAMPPMATVLAGDFNDWSKARTLEGWAPELRFLAPRPSFPSLRPIGALDRIALGKGLAAAAHGVYQVRPAQIASDHLPVWVDLEAVGAP